MASRKVTMEIKIRVTVVVDEGQEISQVVDEMEYNLYDTTGNANVADTEMIDYEITDSR